MKSSGLIHVEFIHLLSSLYPAKTLPCNGCWIFILKNSDYIFFHVSNRTAWEWACRPGVGPNWDRARTFISSPDMKSSVLFAWDSHTYSRPPHQRVMLETWKTMCGNVESGEVLCRGGHRVVSIRTIRSAIRRFRSHSHRAVSKSSLSKWNLERWIANRRLRWGHNKVLCPLSTALFPVPAMYQKHWIIFWNLGCHNN